MPCRSGANHPLRSRGKSGTFRCRADRSGGAQHRHRGVCSDGLAGHAGIVLGGQRGVKIRIEVRFKRAGSPLMHLKSYQIDGRWLRTGAANFSASGLKRQDNDLLIIESRAAATAFERRFDAIFAEEEALPLASEGQPAE